MKFVRCSGSRTFPSTRNQFRRIIFRMDEATDANLPKVLSVLDLLTEEELVQLNRIIVARIRLMQQIKAHGQMMNLRLGQRVRFTTAAGQLVRGTISRHNRKSVTVITDDGHQWRVSPSLLQVDEK